METKRRTERPQWRASRIEGKAEAKPITKRLTEASEELDLKSYYSQKKIDELIEGAAHLAVNHELKQEFFGDARKCMFLLGITEEWERTKDFGEKRRLLDTLSVVSADRREGKTLSLKITRLSAEGLPRGTEFDPSAENTRRSYLEFVSEEIEKDTDEKGTTDLEAQLRDWSDNSIFAHVRRKLGITQREEYPVDFVRLRLNSQRTYDKYGWVGRCVVSNSGKHPTREIIVSSEARREQLEHEYAHSQSASGVAFGFSGILDRGLTEALTEDAISSPSAYLSQRAILFNLLERPIPGFETIAYRAYVSGEQKDLLRMDKLMIARYGLRGRLALARMWAIPNSERRFGRAGECLIDPFDVEYRLRRLKEKSHP